MTRLKILFADDQIPPDEVSDADLYEWAKTHNPNSTNLFLTLFSETRKTVECLRVSGYNIHTARTCKEVKDLIQHLHFDIAVIDLGWGADKSIPESQSRYQGWEICDWIEDADTKFQTKTNLIIYSYKFLEDSALSREAASRGMLPIVKTSNEAGRQSLIAAISFIASTLGSPSLEEQFVHDSAKKLQMVMIETLEEPLRQYRTWFFITAVLVVLSVLALIIGVISTIIGNVTPVGVLASVSSLLTNAIAILLFKQLQKARDEVKRCRSDIISQGNKAMKQFLVQSRKT